MFSKRITFLTHKIYKFDYAVKMDTDKGVIENWNRAQELTTFKNKMIEQYSGYKFSDLSLKYFIEQNVVYKEDKPWLTGTHEIGMDMVKDNTGIEDSFQWDYWYIAIPLSNKPVLEFVKSILPYFVVEKKAINVRIK